MHRAIALALAFPLALLTACGSSPDAACDLVIPAGTQTLHACVEFDNLSSSDMTQVDDACAKQGGKRIDACDADNVLGFCTLTQGGVEAVEYFYIGGGLTVDIAKSGCEGEARGTWTTK
jgi:hypothetical protein